MIETTIIGITVLDITVLGTGTKERRMILSGKREDVRKGKEWKGRGRFEPGLVVEIRVENNRKSVQ